MLNKTKTLTTIARQKTAYEMYLGLVGSEMCIRDSIRTLLSGFVVLLSILLDSVLLRVVFVGLLLI